jgi:tryptophanyl-tRNA synthetase
MRILSGIQPSGQLHLGNYFGSMKPNMEYVGKGDMSLYMIVDLHALTTLHNPEQLRLHRSFLSI